MMLFKSGADSMVRNVQVGNGEVSESLIVIKVNQLKQKTGLQRFDMVVWQMPTERVNDKLQLAGDGYCQYLNQKTGCSDVSCFWQA